jgi:hypothetical protein
MTDCRVEYLLRRGSGPPALSECFRAYPENRAREWAERMARHQQTRARVVGPDGADLAWYLWLPGVERVVEVPVGAKDWGEG